MPVNLRAELPQFSTRSLERESAAIERRLQAWGLDVPCAIDQGARRLLYQVIRAARLSRILEIGTYVGTTTAMLACAVSRMHGEGFVCTVDREDVNAADSYWSRLPGARLPVDRFREIGIASRVRFVRADSADYLADCQERYDLIVIDGWHEAFAVYTDVLLALRLLCPGGLLFLDDVQVPGEPRLPDIDEISGPYQALKWHEARGTPFRVHLNPGTHTAFLLAPS